MIAPPALAGTRHRDVELSTGVRMHVAEAGDPQAPPVILVHGWPQHWWCWRGVIGPLAERYRVLAPDLRGMGWSGPAPDGDYRKERLVDDLLALMDAEGIERARFAGHDWGGYAGFLLARRAPDRLERFLACNIVPPWVSPVRVLPHAWRFAYQVVVGTPALGPALMRDGRAVRMALRPSMSDADAGIFAETYRQPAQAEAASALYRQFLLREVVQAPAGRDDGTVPIKILFGMRDVALRPSMLAGTPYEVEWVPDAGHFIIDERPELVADRALAFFA